MNNAEHPKLEPIEEGIEEEITDLPEMGSSRSDWSSRAAHMLLVWQRSVPPTGAGELSATRVK